MRLTPEALRALEEFHRTPVASLLRRRPAGEGQRREEWAALQARYRAAFAALDAEQGSRLSVCRLPPRERGAAARKRRAGGAR